MYSRYSRLPQEDEDEVVIPAPSICTPVQAPPRGLYEINGAAANESSRRIGNTAAGSLPVRLIHSVLGRRKLTMARYVCRAFHGTTVRRPLISTNRRWKMRTTVWKRTRVVMTIRPAGLHAHTRILGRRGGRSSYFRGDFVQPRKRGRVGPKLSDNVPQVSNSAPLKLHSTISYFPGVRPAS